MSPRRKTGRTRKAAPPALPAAARGGILLLRVWTGAFFLSSAWWKVVQEGYSIAEKVTVFREREYVPTIQRAIAHPPEVFGVTLGLYADFLEHVMLPGAYVLAPLILLFEFVLGISLVLGLGVRLTAALGFLMMLAFSLAKVPRGTPLEDPVGVFLLTVGSANWPVTLILLLLCLAAAGRILGLDAWVRRAGPPWLRWIG